MRDVILSWFKWQAGISARRVMAATRTKQEIEEVLRNYWKGYLVLKPGVKLTGTLGGNVMVHLAAMSTAFYQELRGRGLNEKEATRLFYEITWIVYRKMGKFVWMMTGVRSRNAAKRMSIATRMFRTFPFSGPSYQWKDRASEGNVIAFDCLRCPVAEYFKAQGLSEFCAATWCALDRPLARIWGGELVRGSSIAAGGTVCDFKFISNAGVSNTLAP